MPPYSFLKPKNEPAFSVYKYFGNIEYATNAIVTQSIHLELPSSYNDLFDSTIPGNREFLKRSRNLKNNLVSILAECCPVYAEYFHGLPASMEDTSIDDVLQEMILLNPDIHESSLYDCVIQTLLQGKLAQATNNKISCFSESNTSLLMWSYYANHAKGECIEFDLQRDSQLKRNIHKVQYSQKRPFIGNIFDFYFWKSTEWSHEQEWRIVLDTKEDFLSTNAISSIILGARISKNDRQLMIELARKNGLKLYDTSPSLEEYRLDIKEILL